MQLPTSGQVNAGLRHAGTASASVVTVLAVLGVLSPDQVTAVIADIHQTIDGLQQAFGGVSKLVVIIGPIAGLWFGKAAVASASLRSQLKAVTSNKQVEIKGTIVAPASVAAAVPSDKVVAAPTPPNG